MTRGDDHRRVAGYSGVRDAIDSLVALLRAHITSSDEAGLTGIPVQAGSPHDLEAANIATAVAVWLHRVDREPDLMNREAVGSSADQDAHRPIPLRLGVLVVPLNTDTSTRLLVLGRVYQVVNDHRVLRGGDLAGSLAADGSTLRMVVESPGHYDLNLVWAGQQSVARPGVSLTLAGLSIDTHLPALALHRVLTASAELFTSERVAT